MLNPYYGEYGGQYIPEVLLPALKNVEQAFQHYINDAEFQQRFAQLLSEFAGRETPLTYASNLSAQCGRHIYLKREDLLHGGAHKTNNTLGQCLLAKFMGKKRIVAETGAGQHGVATALAGALLNLDVHVYMGKLDCERQAQNVERMQLFGATVHPVTSGTMTLKDAINDAMRDFITEVDSTFYVFGSAAGPHPYPSMVRYFQSIIGREAKQQILSQAGRLPHAVFACVGGGSNAIGMFAEFIEEKEVALYGAEAAGEGLNTEHHAATINGGSNGVFHGMHSLFIQNDEGQISPTHSISAGLDYPGVGPEHAHLATSGRAHYIGVTDEQALDCYELIARKEGILAAFESCHAVALALELAPQFAKNDILLINLSGRGDKDLTSYLARRGKK